VKKRPGTAQQLVHEPGPAQYQSDDVCAGAVACVEHLARVLQRVAEDSEGGGVALPAQPEGSRIEEFIIGLDGLEFGHDGHAWGGLREFRSGPEWFHRSAG